MWDRFRKLFRGKQKPSPKPVPAAHPKWLPASAETWNIPVLDISPVTHGMISTSSDALMAQNSVSYGNDDGSVFAEQEPLVTRQIECGLRYRVAGDLMDGALFIPKQMEHKWALFASRGRVLFVRGWMRKVYASAETRRVDAHTLELSVIRGAFSNNEIEDPAFTVRAADFLIRTHVLGLPFPVPLPKEFASATDEAALFAFSMFGNMASYAAADPWPETDVPSQSINSASLLHLAAVRGDLVRVSQLLEDGFPLSVAGPGGGTPLHWATLSDNAAAIIDRLIAAGADVDAHSDNEVTPLMMAAEASNVLAVEKLLGSGALPDRIDGRGLSALHRAAERGETAIVRLLLDRGAAPDRDDGVGNTPRTLANDRNEASVLSLFAEYDAKDRP